MEIRITESRRQSKTKYRKQLSDILLETALIGLTAGAGLWLVLEMLTESGQMLPLLGSILLTALLCSVTERMEKCGIYIRCGMAAATAGGLFLLYRQILDGFALYWNTVADTFGSRAGIYFTRFDTADIMAEDTARLVFLIYLGMAAAVIGFLILRFRIYVLVFLEIFVLPFMMVLTGKEPESGVGVAFYMGIFLEINYLLARSGRKRYSEQSRPSGLEASLRVWYSWQQESFWDRSCRRQIMQLRNLLQKQSRKP